MEEKDKQEVQNMIDTSVRKYLTTVTNKKVGDTPLEFFDLVNKGYVDGVGRVHKTSTQSINDQTNTKVIWEAVDFISGITWDATNNRFTTVTGGKYLVTAGTMYTSPAVNGLYEILIFRNGVEYSRMAAVNTVSSAVVTPLIVDSLVLTASATPDYVEIFAFHNSGGAKSIGGANNQCYFTIKRIG